MGLLSGLLSSPAKGLEFVFKQIQNNLDHELYDETIWQQKLLDVQMNYDMGEIDETTYQAQEAAIVAQLDLISAMRYGDEEEDEEYDEEYDDEEVPATHSEPEPVHHQIEVFHDTTYTATTH